MNGLGLSRELTRVEQDRILPSASERDLDVFRARLNGAYYPAFVDVRGEKALRGARLNARALSVTTVGFVRFGSTAIVDPGRLEGYHLNVALAGAVTSECGDQAIVARPGVAAVFSPRGATRLREWSDDAAQICVKIDRHALHRELELILGRPVDRDVDVDIAVPTGSGAGATLLGALLLLLDSVATDPAVTRAVGHLERAVIAQLLYAARHEYRQEMHDGGGRMTPLSVRRVKTLIDENPDTFYMASDLAAHARVGVRRLEQAFREHVGLSPLAYHQRVRLQHAHDDLLVPRVGDTVTVVMTRWGFSNHARFAAAYRAQFGVNPAETLRRSASR